LQCVAVREQTYVLQFVAVCCKMLSADICVADMCVAVCCSVLQCVAVCCSKSADICVAVCCSVLQCVAVCCEMMPSLPTPIQFAAGKSADNSHV